MDYFSRHQQQLFCENVALDDIAARFGTPCYVYSRATIERHWHAFDQAFAEVDHLVCYAVKANSNLAVLNMLARLGSGFDIVSAGELERVLAAGGEASKVVFSGVGKRREEIEFALQKGVYCINVESRSELARIQQVAQAMGLVASVSLRVNPDVDAKTHPYISTGLKENKFGIDFSEAIDAYRDAAAMANIEIKGIDCHIGSQLTDTAPFADATHRVVKLIQALLQEGISLSHIDIGGGLGVSYRDEVPPLPNDYAKAVLSALLPVSGIKVLLEPGRAIVANAGVLLTRVEYLKYSSHKNFAIVDAAMNDLMRPALYQAWQDITPVNAKDDAKTKCYDVVGPVCETGDFLGKDRDLALSEGDLLAVRSSGAYGASMSSNYNSRPRAAEVVVDGDVVHLVRERETIADLMQGETMLP
ncbi:MAG: diaminopimelate decarboxylase [Gammaproteobacteria bacterium]|nr:diaminopimelate decarboxylase [Beggiatoa alba]PCH61249.1 MAG: diaminopimelate decarboxylase [Gammaproteobacteria bacterium]